MSKYKLTNRGKIAILILGIALIVVFVSMIIGNNEENKDKLDNIVSEKTDSELNKTVEVETSQIENRKVTDANAVISDIESREIESVDYEDDDSNNVTIEENNEEIKRIVVYFSPDSAIIDEEFQSDINDFVDEALEFEENNIVIEGNINGYPYFKDSEFGKKLSQKRADVLKGIMLDMGIAESRISTISNGSSKPAEKKGDTDRLYLNRRVDVYFEKYGLSY